jgi:tRNA modification GTPase
MPERTVIGGFLTAPGDGALQVLRVAGRGVPDFLGRVFRPRGSAGSAGGGPRLGLLLDGDTVVDEVLVHLGEDGHSAEITTHGGRLTQRAVEDLLQRHGVDLVEASRLLERDLFREPGSSVDREAVAGLGRAWAREALHFFLEVLERGLVREVVLLRDALREEAWRDGPPRAARRLVDRIETLIRRAPFGCAFGEPPRLVLLGRPNAGKSTLANALFERERCLVTEEPGTTRDVVRDQATVLAYPFEIADTAGLRETEDPDERAGTRSSLGAARHAGLRLVLHPVDRPEAELASLLEEVEAVAPGAGRTVVVLTKADLVAEARARAAETATRVARPTLAVSARDGSGVDELRRFVLARSPFAGPSTGAMPCPFTPRQVGLLEEAGRNHAEGRSKAAAEALDRLLEGPVAP